ncbi:MAG: protein nirF [Planctomycetota bacterium]|nr:MAG: protein nirF [Planctomycetota bacterium]
MNCLRLAGPFLLAASTACGLARANDLPSSEDGTGVAGRVFVVERASESLAVYDLLRRRLLPQRIEGLGNLRHATMVFSPDLRYGYLATRSGKVTRIDLETLRPSGEVYSSRSSIDNAISQDGRFLAVGEYAPGGLTLLDARTLKVLKRIPGSFERDGQEQRSRVTGVVDAPGNRFVCVLMEGAEVWIVDASRPGFPVEHRIPTPHPQPYDAMITPDGRHYLVGHLLSGHVSVVDLVHPERGAREVSLRDPHRNFAKAPPVKLPHMAAWAVAGEAVFVPLVGEKRLAVLDRATWTFRCSVPLRGHPVYAVASPTEREVWVSFSGEDDDAYVQVVDTARCEVVRTLEVGGRIYHMDFTPRGSHVLVSANRANQLVLIDANAYRIEDREQLRSPSGVFGAWRAFRMGL